MINVGERRENMNSLFESIKQGLNEAIEYEQGNLSDVKVDRISVAPPYLHCR